MQPTAKNLILGLLLAGDGRPLSARDAINACQLFGITANNVRVALVRLSAEGLIQSQGRGTYELGPTALNTANAVANWHATEQQLLSWNGTYIGVHTSALGRTDRKALRQRERALEMIGLRELNRGLYLRPNNIKGSVEVLRKRLLSLGLDAEAVMFVATEFDVERNRRIEQLWDGATLNLKYRDESDRLNAWMTQHSELELDVAARESYLIGSQAIRQLVFDPWLPEPMIDTAARRTFVESVRRFDKVGKVIWMQLHEAKGGMPIAPATSPLQPAPFHLESDWQIV